MKIVCDECCASYLNPGHPERPERILDSLALLRRQTDLPVEWVAPTPVDDEAILRAHEPEYLGRLRVARDFDNDTFYFPEVEKIARLSAGAAVLAMELARKGDVTFSLMRPPGHHATRSEVMGFCYLSNIAIAALQALATGTRRVAVFDFDVHHGNGTEDVLLNRPGAAFFSVHEHPCYPGTGAGDVGDNCFNFTVAPGASREMYRAALSRALASLKAFRPELVGVSAGFDAYSGDPLANSPLEAEDFRWLGRELRAVGAPMFSVLEGGYSERLPELILSYLKGIHEK